MAVIAVVKKKVRLANTHNVLTRTRPLAGAASVGDAVEMDANGAWIKSTTGVCLGVILSIHAGGLEKDDGVAGDDAEVLMWGIVAGYTVGEGVIAYDAGDGTLLDTGTTEQKIGIGLNDNLLFVRPAI